MLLSGKRLIWRIWYARHIRSYDTQNLTWKCFYCCLCTGLLLQTGKMHSKLPLRRWRCHQKGWSFTCKFFFPFFEKITIQFEYQKERTFSVHVIVTTNTIIIPPKCYFFLKILKMTTSIYSFILLILFNNKK